MYYYENEFFENYQDLAKKHPSAAAELLHEFGEGKWQESELCWYPSKKDFAIYEVEDGWYSDINIKLIMTNFRGGAPNLLDFIDFDALGSALIEMWDSSYYFETTSGEIVTTKYGW